MTAGRRYWTVQVELILRGDFEVLRFIGHAVIAVRGHYVRFQSTYASRYRWRRVLSRRSSPLYRRALVRGHLIVSTVRRGVSCRHADAHAEVVGREAETIAIVEANIAVAAAVIGADVDILRVLAFVFTLILQGEVQTSTRPKKSLLR